MSLWDSTIYTTQGIVEWNISRIFQEHLDTPFLIRHAGRRSWILKAIMLVCLVRRVDEYSTSYLPQIEWRFKVLPILYHICTYVEEHFDAIFSSTTLALLCKCLTQFCWSIQSCGSINVCCQICYKVEGRIKLCLVKRPVSVSTKEHFDMAVLSTTLANVCRYFKLFCPSNQSGVSMNVWCQTCHQLEQCIKLLVEVQNFKTV